MSPKKGKYVLGMSAAEKAEASFAKGNSILVRAKRNAVIQVMDRSPEVIDTLIHQLKSQGHDVLSIIAEKQGKKRGLPTLMDAPDHSGLPKFKIEPHELDIPRCVTLIGGGKLEVYMRLLHEAEPCPHGGGASGFRTHPWCWRSLPT
jgi:hypothetical protein